MSESKTSLCEKRKERLRRRLQFWGGAAFGFAFANFFYLVGMEGRAT